MIQMNPKLEITEARNRKCSTGYMYKISAATKFCNLIKIFGRVTLSTHQTIRTIFWDTFYLDWFFFLYLRVSVTLLVAFALEDKKVLFYQLRFDFRKQLNMYFFGIVYINVCHLKQSMISNSLW